MAKKYGMPYKGSKARIAEWVVDTLPVGRRFVDLFCGGCSVTHCAMLSNKWHDFLINDINPMMPQAFVKAAHGGFKGEDRWISREDFFKLKDTDAYAAMCFSFGNDLRTYAFGKDLEPMKKAAHYAIFFGDMTFANELGINITLKGNTRAERYSSWRAAIKAITERESFKRQECFERQQQLESLQSLLALESLSRDYRDITIIEGDVVYCDIPYKGTNKYGNGFDHDAFYEWVLSRDFPVFVSEYQMPEDFAPIASIGLRSLMDAKATQSLKTERIFVQRKYADAYTSELFGFNQ